MRTGSAATIAWVALGVFGFFLIIMLISNYVQVKSQEACWACAASANGGLYYTAGYDDAWEKFSEVSSRRSIFDYLDNIEEIQPALRGCAINYYLDTYPGGNGVMGWWQQNQSDGQMRLFNKDGWTINCSKYEVS